MPQDGAPPCPFCGSDDTELLSLFGSQLLTEQRYCRTCHTPYEAITRDEAPAQPPAVSATPPDDHA
ncbi:MAG TPA: hypothetical protein VGR57_03590 [Ktedonobacterales bacterium]|nr:hypothetical protein [Ktedonobacterales bacterium]